MNAFRSLAPLGAAVIGGGVMAFSFVFGIPAALDGSGSGAGVFSALFVVGGLLVLAGFVGAVIQLVVGHERALAIVTLLVVLVPAIIIGLIAILARTSV